MGRGRGLGPIGGSHGPVGGGERARGAPGGREDGGGAGVAELQVYPSGDVNGAPARLSRECSPSRVEWRQSSGQPCR